MKRLGVKLHLDFMGSRRYSHGSQQVVDTRYVGGLTVNPSFPSPRKIDLREHCDTTLARLCMIGEAIGSVGGFKYGIARLLYGDIRTQYVTELCVGHCRNGVRKKRLHFGLVFQNFNLFPQYTALQNVMLAGELLAKERPDYKANKKAIHAELEQQAQELLAQMGLSARAGHYPHQLSGGQQQRVAIARALALHPDILCFDEPTSALDPELTGEVLRVLRDLADRKTTMIIVTHEMHFARDVADRIMFMDGGVVVEEGPAKQLIEHPQEERTKQFLAHYSE